MLFNFGPLLFSELGPPYVEIGDRTFFIAALMSVKHSQLTVFLGAFAALAAMTVVSTVMGVAAPLFLPRWLVHW